MGPATREMKGEAKALFILPQFLRGAFVFGGARGSDVSELIFVVRNQSSVG